MAGASLRYIDRGIEKAAFYGQDCVAPNSDFTASASSSSVAVKEYEDKLKAIMLCRRGVAKNEVAERIGRPERWVQKWWRQEPKLLTRPYGAQNSVFQKTPLSGFRDVEFWRGLAQDPDLFSTLAREVHWRPGKVMTRDSETGELVLRFDRNGQTIPASRKVADCPIGIDSLDRVLQKVFTKANIRDPQARVVLNLYEDESKTLNSHRHDYWTCLVSFGAPRVLLVDNRPYVMGDGDMITFGTQMHGVPAMASSTYGRISLVIFFYPDRDNLERRWRTVLGSDADIAEDEATVEDGQVAELTVKQIAFCSDCRSGSASTTSVPGAVDLVVLGAALTGEAFHDRPYWRKSNAELQGMEYPSLPGANVYSLGCGHVSMCAFLKCLACLEIELLWDLRTPEVAKAAVRAGDCAAHFLQDHLREALRGCIRSYRTWPIGTTAAGGLPQHLFCTEEGSTLVYRILREAQRAKICFLGTAEAWHLDNIRQSIAVALTQIGANVVHLRVSTLSDHFIGQSDSEAHPTHFELPDRLQPPSSTFRRNEHIDKVAPVCHDEVEPFAEQLENSGQAAGGVEGCPGGQGLTGNKDVAVASRRWRKYAGSLDLAITLKDCQQSEDSTSSIAEHASPPLIVESASQVGGAKVRTRWQRCSNSNNVLTNVNQ